MLIPNNLLVDFCEITHHYSLCIKAGGVLLPTFAGYENIWCGGPNTVLQTSAGVVGLGYNSELQVSYSVSSLTVYSSACSFQGAYIHHTTFTPI